MGRLTEDMTRLCSEIGTLHKEREGFITELKDDVADMKAGFNSDHADMAKKLRDDLGTFISKLGDDVADMKAGFNSDHADMAKKLRDDFDTFISKLKNTDTAAKLSQMIPDLEDREFVLQAISQDSMRADDSTKAAARKKRKMDPQEVR